MEFQPFREGYQMPERKKLVSYQDSVRSISETCSHPISLERKLKNKSRQDAVPILLLCLGRFR